MLFFLMMLCEIQFVNPYDFQIAGFRQIYLFLSERLSDTFT